MTIKANRRLLEIVTFSLRDISGLCGPLLNSDLRHIA